VFARSRFAAIFAELDASLTRLGMDYVDLYQIHRFDHDTPIEETLEVLHDVVKAGKVRYIGASSMHAWQFRADGSPSGSGPADEAESAALGVPFNECLDRGISKRASARYGRPPSPHRH
jgi:hypothetical protein